MDTCDRKIYKNSEKLMYLELLIALYKNNFYIQSKKSKQNSWCISLRAEI